MTNKNKTRYRRLLTRLALVLAMVAITSSACSTLPINATDDVCTIFRAKYSWHKTALSVERGWQLKPHVAMAIMYHESKFRRKAKPPRRYLLGFIPWKRRSTAYGYAQAVDGTWRNYIQETRNRGASRDNFHDSLDFMGWYIDKSHRLNNIPKDDAYEQYLAYHEGWTGYRNKSWAQKKWLQRVAKDVSKRASLYESQYNDCKSDLPVRRWRWFG